MLFAGRNQSPPNALRRARFGRFGRIRLSYIYKGMFAGVVAAIVLAAGMHIASQMALLHSHDFVVILGNLTGTGLIGGLVLHCMIGAAWGAAFAFLDPDLPGDNLRQRGVIFSLGLATVMLLLFLPLTGAGFLGLHLGTLMPLYVVFAHMGFGAILGGFYAWLFVQALPMRYRLSGWSRSLPLR
jgi:hypothetical protein